MPSLSRSLKSCKAVVALCFMLLLTGGNASCEADSLALNDTLFSARIVISDEVMGARAVVAGDLDGDGDVDLVSASSTDNTVAWYENLGDRQFSGKTKITFDARGARIVTLGDVDGDTILDIIVASYYDDTLGWFKNDGRGSFSDRLVISEAVDEGQGVVSADFDGDGDLDVASASSGDNSIAWFQNLGDGKGSFCEVKVVVDNDAIGARTVVAADFDGDGQVDLASASKDDNSFSIYLNSGADEPTMRFPTKTVVNNTAKGAYSLVAVDINKDGNIDLVTASNGDDTVAWYENDGTGKSFKWHGIYSGADFVLSVFAADFDHDGDIDVASASFFDGAIRWYENVDGTAAQWLKHDLLVKSGTQGHYVFGADMDQDGDTDLLSATHAENTIAVFYSDTECDDAASATCCESGQSWSGSQCVDCTTGTYGVGTGAAATCIPCPSGCTVAGLIRTPHTCSNTTGCADFAEARATCTAMADVTECDLGHVFNFTTLACHACPPGSAAVTKHGKTSCEACPKAYYSPQAAMASCLGCEFGMFSDIEGATACRPCPTGATCDASSLTVDRGRWRSAAQPYELYECPITEACLGGNTTLYSCAPGYAGVLCAVCQPGHVRTGDRCASCNTLPFPTTALLLAVIAGALVCAVWFLTRTNTTFAAALESISFSVPFKIYFATCQILGAYSVLLSDVLFQPLKAFLARFTFFTDLAELLGGFGFSCAHHELQDFRARLLISTTLPIVVILCGKVVFLCRALASRPSQTPALRRAHATFVLLVLYVSLPSTSTMIFKTFVRDSRPLGPNGEQYLIADYAVNTESTEHKQFLIPYAVICIFFYPLGMNALYVVLLWRNRAAIRLEKDSTIDAKAKLKLIGGGGTIASFLHHPYSRNHFWWEAVDSTRRVLLVGVPALIELPAARLSVALGISIIFLVIQHEHKPYDTAEHNALAELAGAQITATLLFIVMQSTISIPQIFGFFCIVLNVILVPIVICFNVRRLTRRKDILNAFLVDKAPGKVTKRGFSLSQQAPAVGGGDKAKNQAKKTSIREIFSEYWKGDQKNRGIYDFFNPSYFREYWEAGHRSEYEVFCATLEWMDAALERPVSDDRWGQLLFTLEHLPLSSSENADVRHGLTFDTKNLTPLLVKKFELGLGFAQGERWYGVVMCDEREDSERVRSGTFEGELMLISKQTIPNHKVRVNSKIQEVTLLDIKRDGTNMSITIPYTATLWIATKALAWKHDCALVNSMRDVRTSEARGSAKFRETCNAASFGSSSADTTMSDAALALQNDYPVAMRGELDKDIYTRLLLCSARASAEFFRSTLSQLFPGANFQEGHSDSPYHIPSELTITFAPVKGLERTLVKFEEYSSDDGSQWPVTPQVRDTLRAKIEAPNGDQFADATEAIMSTFSVREGNGRFKNNLMTEKHQPPNLLINLVLRPPDMPPITAEVQIYLRDIEQLNEHRYYEIIRAPTPGKLLEEGRVALERFKNEQRLNYSNSFRGRLSSLSRLNAGAGSASSNETEDVSSASKENDTSTSPPIPPVGTQASCSRLSVLGAVGWEQEPPRPLLARAAEHQDRLSAEV